MSADRNHFRIACDAKGPCRPAVPNSNQAVRMRWMIALLAVASLAGSAATARAQDPMYGGSGVEITPIVGYRWGGGLSSVSGFREVDTQDNWSYGVSLGKRLPAFSSVEIAYTHFAGDVEAT